MANDTIPVPDWNETWSLTRGGYFAWLSASVLASLCLVVFRSRPSNGLGNILIQFFVAEMVSIALWMTSDGLNLTSREPLLHSVMLWWQAMIVVFEVGVFVRLAAALGFKRKPATKGLTILSWVMTVLMILATTSLYFFQIVKVAYYAIIAYYSLGILFLWLVVVRDWFQATCGSPKSKKPTIKAKSVFAGLGSKAFTTIGHLGILAAIASFIIVTLGTLEFKIWRYTFLACLIGSVLFVPLFVTFIIWADCPANIKMLGIADDLADDVLKLAHHFEMNKELGLKAGNAENSSVALGEAAAGPLESGAHESEADSDALPAAPEIIVDSQDEAINNSMPELDQKDQAHLISGEDESASKHVSEDNLAYQSELLKFAA